MDALGREQLDARLAPDSPARIRARRTAGSRPVEIDFDRVSAFASFPTPWLGGWSPCRARPSSAPRAVARLSSTSTKRLPHVTALWVVALIADARATARLSLRHVTCRARQPLWAMPPALRVMFLEQCDTANSNGVYEDFDLAANCVPRNAPSSKEKYDFGNFFEELDAAFPEEVECAENVAVLPSPPVSALAKASRIKATITTTARFYPFCLDSMNQGAVRVSITPQHSLIAILNEARLN